MRFHAQTGGSTLTAQQPENNVVRVAIQSMAAVMGGTQSLHTNGYDEALSLPSQQAAQVALRTQQIIGYESGIVDTPDPLAGSYFVESLTDEVERLAWEYIDRIDEMGGAVAGIEAGFQQGEIEQAAYEYAKSIDDDERIIVGLNKFASRPTATRSSSLRILSWNVARRRRSPSSSPPATSPWSKPASPTSLQRRAARRTCCTR